MKKRGPEPNKLATHGGVGLGYINIYDYVWLIWVGLDWVGLGWVGFMEMRVRLPYEYVLPNPTRHP